jgi:hypothetical protein
MGATMPYPEALSLTTGQPDGNQPHSIPTITMSIALHPG